MEIRTVRVSDLKLHPKNPRVHPASALEKLQRSIVEFGWTNPILVSKDGMVLAGHARLKAAQAAGIEEVPVIYLPLEGAKAEAYMIADNKLQDETGWDFSVLKDLLEQLDTGEFDIGITGFDPKEIEELMAQFHVPQEGLTDDDAIPEHVETICKRSDLWQLGEHRLLCGDATKKADVERLMGGEKADMVFTDPPYGIDYSGGRTQVVAKKDYGKLLGDDSADISRFVWAIVEAAGGRDYYVCLSPINIKESLPLFPEYEGIIVWKKPQPGLGYQWIRRYCEFIIFGTQRKKPKAATSEFDFWEIATDPKNEYQHGTQKPVALAARAIQFSSKVNNGVLDLFGGSGSTLIACEKLGRRCFMMEIDEHYCDVIIQRWQNFTGRQAVKL